MQTPTLRQHGRKAVVKLLLDAKASVDAKGFNGQTALHEAVCIGYKAVVRLLIGSNADVKAFDGLGCSLVDMSERNANRAMLKLLREAQKRKSHG